MKKVQIEDDFNPKNTQCGNSALKKTRFNYNIFLESEYSEIIKTTSNKNKNNLHINASSIMKIKKVDKQILFTKSKSGLLYTTTDFIECLIENVDYQYRRLVIKQVTKFKLITINDLEWC